MSEIEDKVVSLKFDNAGFEQKVASTLKALGNLSTSISNADKNNGLEALQKSANSFKMEGVANAAEGVSKKFIALSTIAVTALATITKKAIDTGARIASSFTFDPIKQGFEEYETNMNSIQTILANTASDGTTLENVSDALDLLNTYADQTIYNFSEMTRNIGTFTAAGVDLETSTNAIKGIANLAAISGSNSGQAASAMYQLSQALATGSLKLQDWNSVVNAGLGGEVFQKALFESGKALGAIPDVPIEQTFEQWKDSGNSFRQSLESGWISAEVLTNTLQGFTGDLTKAQILSMGYTDAQAEEIIKLGAMGKAAATEVKTLTQLLDTVQEAIGSGWSQSFKLILGDFEEAKALFTGVSDFIGALVGESADQRNAVLQQWRDLGGRELLIDGIKNAVNGIADVIRPIKNAFREIFPRSTGADLFVLTRRFAEFTEKLKVGPVLLNKIKRIATGFFNIFKIGITIVKEIKDSIVDLWNEFGPGEGAFLDTAAGIGDFITSMRKMLVEGGGIKRFFEDLVEFIKDPLPVLEELRDKFFNLFDPKDGVPGADEAATFFDRLRLRIGQLGAFIGNVVEGFGKFADIFKNFEGPDIPAILDGIKTKIGEFWTKVKSLFTGKDTEEILDYVNTGLFGALLAAFVAFAKDGIGLFPNGIFGDTEDLFEGLSDTFEELTGVLKSMQNNIRADTLLKIAKALGVLTISLVVLSLIDSAALTKALTATAVGFGQLIGTLALLEKATTSIGATKVLIVAGSMVLLGAAILVLALAVKFLSTMDWSELGRGLAAVAGLLLMLVLSMNGLSGMYGGLVRAGAGILIISVAMLVLAGAVKLFSLMDMDEIGRGLAGIGGGLAIIVAAMNLLPSGMVTKSLGILITAVALNILYFAVKQFADLSWEEIGRGLAAMAGALGAIALALYLMPSGPLMILQATGLLAVSVALNLIATAMASFADLSWEEIARGLTALAGSLVILALAAQAMSGSLLGALAISAMALSLGQLVIVLKAASKLSFGDLAKGLAVLAISLGVLAGVAYLLTPAILPMLGLAAALTLMGAAAVLFGAGALLAAKAFGIIADKGEAGLTVFIKFMNAVASAIPRFILILAGAILELIQLVLSALPGILGALGEILTTLLGFIKEFIPELIVVVKDIVLAFVAALDEMLPQLLDAGLRMLKTFLTGIRDNIGEITTLVADIIINFLDALEAKVPAIVDSLYNLLVTIFTELGKKLKEVAQILVPKGIDLLKGLYNGIIEKAPDVLNWFKDLPGVILEKLGDLNDWLVDKAKDLLAGALKGAIAGGIAFFKWFKDLPGAVLEKLGDLTGFLTNKGKDLLKGMYTGITTYFTETLSPWIKGLPGKIKDVLGNLFTTLGTTGINLMKGFRNGMVSWINESIIPWLKSLPGKIVGWIGSTFKTLNTAGINLVIGLWNGIVSKSQWIKDKIGGFVSGIKNVVTSGFGIFSPSRVMKGYGEYIGEGLAIGIDNSAKDVNYAAVGMVSAAKAGVDSKDITESLRQSLADLPKMVGGLDAMHPTIRPVLDLTQVKKDAKSLGEILPGGEIGETISNASYLRAKALALAAIQDPVIDVPESSEPKEVVFNQTINAPTRLSTNDIYRGTKSQIAIAKEELSIS